MGHGSTVLVAGEAGIGKTSLLRSFQAAPGRARILSGTCEDLFMPRPLGPLLEAARATQGPLAEALRAPVDQNWLNAAVADELGAPPSPTVLVIEDAHWADGATIDVLRFITARIRSIPAVVIISFRDDELGAGHPLRTLLGGLSSADAARLTLHRLSAGSVSRMAATSGVDRDELFRLTGGNPFFVSEVLAFPDQTVPPTVVDAVLARVAAPPAVVPAAPPPGGERGGPSGRRPGGPRPGGGGAVRRRGGPAETPGRRSRTDRSGRAGRRGRG